MGKDLFNPHLRKFSIRKLNIGVCSVLLSTLILLGAASQVSADETSASNVQNEVARTDLAEPSSTATAPVVSEASQNSGTTLATTVTEAHNQLRILHLQTQLQSLMRNQRTSSQ